jgi:hypothetical protein
MLEVLPTISNINKKFWEDLIACFPYISSSFEGIEPNLMYLNLIQHV